MVPLLQVASLIHHLPSQYLCHACFWLEHARMRGSRVATPGVGSKRGGLAGCREGGGAEGGGGEGGCDEGGDG